MTVVQPVLSITQFAGGHELPVSVVAEARVRAGVIVYVPVLPLPVPNAVTVYVVPLTTNAKPTMIVPDMTDVTVSVVLDDVATKVVVCVSKF